MSFLDVSVGWRSGICCAFGMLAGVTAIHMTYLYIIKEGIIQSVDVYLQFRSTDWSKIGIQALVVSYRYNNNIWL
jgi:hypothetical protein